METVEETPMAGGQGAEVRTLDNKVKLKSSDGEIFEVDKMVAYQSQTVKLMVEDMEKGATIPLPSVPAKFLSIAIVYCKYHVQSEKSSDEDKINRWDAEFMMMDRDELYDLMKVAHYLNIEHLVDLICQFVADIMKDYSSELIRSMLFTV